MDERPVIGEPDVRSSTSFEISVDTGQCNPPSDPLDRVELEETASA